MTLVSSVMGDGAPDWASDEVAVDMMDGGFNNFTVKWEEEEVDSSSRSGWLKLKQ